MLAKFTSKKNSILHGLHRRPDDYQDLSPKGYLDDEIRDLVDHINRLPGYVTTSSCAGRLALYLDGPAATHASGKGGGRWLFVSHAPLAEPDALEAALGFSPAGAAGGPSFPPPGADVQFVHLKFEPMILHILCETPDHAQTALTAAFTSGFRESGLTAISDPKGRPAAPTLAVRSSGLALDCIVAYQAAPPATPTIIPLVHPAYLRTVLDLANARFRLNAARRARFWAAWQRQPGQALDARIGAAAVDPAGSPRSPAYERAADVEARKRARAMRKRDEALQRRELKLHRGGALDGAGVGEGDGDGDEDEDGELGLRLLDLQAAEEEGGGARCGGGSLGGCLAETGVVS